MAVYSALRDRPTEFIGTCRSIPRARPEEEPIASRTGKKHNKRFNDLANQFLHDQTMDPALRFYFLNRTTHSACVDYSPSRRKSICACAEKNWNVVFTSRMEQFAEHIRDVQLTCGDFAPLFREPGEGVLIYADPPCACETDAPNRKKLYAGQFTWDDHERLAQEIRNCSHSVLLSYDDDPRIRELYQGFNIYEESWVYCGSTAKTKKRGRELVITNYPAKEQSMELPLIDFSDVDVAA